MSRNIVIIIFILTLFVSGCNNKEANTSSEEGQKIDIQDLFMNTDEIKSIGTMIIDTAYLLEDSNLIDDIISILEDIEYEEVNTELESSNNEGGPSATGISLTFTYNDGTIRRYYQDNNNEGHFVEYSQNHYNPYELIVVNYKIDKNIRNKIMKIMSKGQITDLNQQ